jgi:outer membrane protein assembly factor BamD
MAHYRMMAKADRDRVEARLAEAELKEFLLKYPDNRLKSRVKNRLRQVQEVLAQGDDKIAQFYYQRGVWPAARSRYQEIVDGYPNYSRADDSLWYLGQSLEHLKKSNEAVPYYDRILKEHPLSERVEDAKGRLTAMKQPIPRPTKAILARAEADALHHKTGSDPLSKLGGMMSSRPDTSATRRGPVHLGAPPPTEPQVAATSTPGTASVSAQPVSDASLSTGKPVEVKPAASDPSGQATGTDKAASSTATKGSDSANSPAPKKKRSIFKKIIKPF